MEDFNQFSFNESEFVDFGCNNIDNLNKYIKQLDKCFKKQSDNFAEICFVVYKIKELFDNYKQVYSKRNNNLSYSFDSIMLGFGIGKSEYCKILKCYEKFITKETEKPMILAEFYGFSKSKLFELLQIENKQIVDDLHNNVIRFDFTVNQLRAYAKNVINLKKEQLKLFEKEDDVIEEKFDDIPLAYNPTQHYDFEFFEEKNKSQLLNIVWDLQKEYEKLKKEFNKLKKQIK